MRRSYGVEDPSPASAPVAVLHEDSFSRSKTTPFLPALSALSQFVIDRRTTWDHGRAARNQSNVRDQCQRFSAIRQMSGRQPKGPFYMLAGLYIDLPKELLI